MIGETLGHYKLEEQIGAGGMGVVYRATDTKLGRQVAIKVLPEKFARDAERLARFKREARLLAALNHPHIAAIHGLEESLAARTISCSNLCRARRWKARCRSKKLSGSRARSPKPSKPPTRRASFTATSNPATSRPLRRGR